MSPWSGPRAAAGDADRERLLGLLREHYALGNLDDADFDRRAGLVLAAAYTDEAAARAGGPSWVGVGAYLRAIQDPASRQIVRVWVDPADGSRHYVPEPPGQ